MQGLRTGASVGSSGFEERPTQKSSGQESFLALAANTDISVHALHFPSLRSLCELGRKGPSVERPRVSTECV